VSVVCCAGSGLCYELITRVEESCLCFVFLIACDLDISTVRRSRPELGCSATEKNISTVKICCTHGTLIACSNIVIAFLTEAETNSLKTVGFFMYHQV